MAVRRRARLTAVIAETRPPAPPDPAPDPPRVDSEALLRGSRLLLIDHGGETYALRLTRQGRLLLTK